MVMANAPTRAIDHDAAEEGFRRTSRLAYTSASPIQAIRVAAAAPPAEAKPVEPGITSTGAPTRGKLPKAVIDEKLRSAQPGIQACYEAALKTKPDLRGSVNISFVVAPDGKVAHAEVAESEGALTDASTVECILGQIRKLEFPEPSGGRVFLNYPLQLEPPK